MTNTVNSKPDLLLLHGALGSTEQMIPLKQHLSRWYTIHLMNFRGHGDKKNSGKFTIPAFTADLIQFIKEHTLDPVHIFGYSMGGYVAINTALYYPELIRKIVTLGTRFDWDPVFAASQIHKLQPQLILQKVPAFAEILKKRHTADGWENVIQHTAELMKTLGGGEAISTEDLSKIDHEVLLMIGDSDDTTTVKETIETAQLMRNGEHKILSNTHHPIANTDLQLISNEIHDFISDT